MGYIQITEGSGTNVATITLTRDDVTENIQLSTAEYLVYPVTDGDAHNGNVGALFVAVINLSATAQTGIMLSVWDSIDQSGQEYQIAPLDESQIWWLPPLRLTSGYFSTQASGSPTTPGLGVVYR